MPELELVGDWSNEDAARIVALIKSLGIGDGAGIPEGLIPPAIAADPVSYLSERQKKLIELLKGGAAAITSMGEGQLTKSGELLPASNSIPWDYYERSSLEKSLESGAIEIDGGVRRQLSASRRYEDLHVVAGDIVGFNLPRQVGEFGYGIYISSLEKPTGGARLRVSLGLTPDELITEEEFSDLEESLTDDINTLLTGKGVQAIAVEEGDRVALLFVRETAEITPIGFIDEGVQPSPGTKVSYRLISIQPQGNNLTADLEVVSDARSLNKSARLKSNTLIDGTPLISGGPALDRGLIRDAIERCRLDGVPDINAIERLSGRPDFLPKGTVAFYLPQEKRIWLCPFDPQERIKNLVSELTDRLKQGVSAGAVSADQALDVVAIASKLSPEWYLEMLIKRYAGIGLAFGNPIDGSYAMNLAGRGWQFWGSRKRYETCIGEDFRCAFDPSGIPNLVTLEWDLAVPSLTRAGQALIQQQLV